MVRISCIEILLCQVESIRVLLAGVLGVRVFRTALRCLKVPGHLRRGKLSSWPTMRSVASRPAELREGGAGVRVCIYIYIYTRAWVAPGARPSPVTGSRVQGLTCRLDKAPGHQYTRALERARACADRARISVSTRVRVCIYIYIYIYTDKTSLKADSHVPSLGTRRTRTGLALGPRRPTLTHAGLARARAGLALEPRRLTLTRAGLALWLPSCQKRRDLPVKLRHHASA